MARHDTGGGAIFWVGWSVYNRVLRKKLIGLICGERSLRDSIGKHSQILICASPPQKRPINFFLSTLLYTDQPTQKTAPPPVACLPFQPLPFQRSAEGNSPLPFPDSGMLLRGSVNLCDTKPVIGSRWPI